MKRYEYLKYAIDKKYYMDIAWFFAFFTILDIKMKDNNYLRYKNNKFEVEYKGNWEELDFVVANEPVYTMVDKLTIDKTMISTIKSPITSTIGRYFANKLLLEYPFGNKFEYIDGSISIKDIEKNIANGLIDNTIRVKEYTTFVDSVNYMKNLSRIVTVSATYKNILPPDGIEKFKKDKLAEYDKKYGPNWKKDRVKVLEFKEELKNFDKEWLKDDPSYGKLTSGKITDNTRVKMYLTFGDESGFDSSKGEFEFIENSLLENYPKDSKKLTAMYNTARSGSYERGKETQKGGVAAKEILRSTSGLSIKGDDCGSKKGMTYKVTKDIADSLKGRYLISGSKAILIEDPDKYIGKEIEIRSPMYCLNKNDSFCATCVGKILAMQKDGIAMSVLNISEVITTTNMKKMHDTQLRLVEINLENILV